MKEREGLTFARFADGSHAQGDRLVVKIKGSDPSVFSPRNRISVSPTSAPPRICRRRSSVLLQTAFAFSARMSASQCPLVFCLVGDQHSLYRLAS